ncbi:hypothetical protein FE257_008920 [Aspergillus nanangensis]|uniref:Uncharacterized protein n=1 Tax=Aspergillus nanangensis TaxID=2582783 RepID=A0AAD4CWE5_ASPNN|nr:hypothetical protein FE257_008920 [Aspergillus nanangensis]
MSSFQPHANFYYLFIPLDVSRLDTDNKKKKEKKYTMQYNTAGFTNDIPAPYTGQTPQSVASLRLYRRLAHGKKALFAPSDTAAADYFIVNPIPQKQRRQWKPIFYRGDNPKYTPTSTVMGRAFRIGAWKSFHVQLGEGVREVQENERRKAAASKLRIKNKFRKTFGAQQKAPTEDLDQREVVGKVVEIPVRRAGFTRKVEFELGGVQYQWKGTRMYSASFMRGVKGWSQSLKLVRKHDNALIAGVDKRRWATFESSIRSEGPPNQSKRWTGTLYFYDPSAADAEYGVIPAIRVVDEDATTSHHVNEPSELTDAITITCWIVVEAEHRLRMLVLDYLQQAGKEGGGA